MTYTLFEYAKDNKEQFMENHHPVHSAVSRGFGFATFRLLFWFYATSDSFLLLFTYLFREGDFVSGGF